MTPTPEPSGKQTAVDAIVSLARDHTRRLVVLLLVVAAGMVVILVVGAWLALKLIPVSSIPGVQFSTSSVGVPVGGVVAFAGPALPDGWARCNGQVVAVSKDSKLLLVLGTRYGPGEVGVNGDLIGVTLPDYSGQFLRGVDASGRKDPDWAKRTASTGGTAKAGEVGTVQDGQVGDHKHNIVRTGNQETAPPMAVVAGKNDGSGGAQGMTEPHCPGCETRPTNIAVQYIIRVSE